MFKGVKNYLRMTTDPTASEAANKLINSDLKEIGDATKKFANHVIHFLESAVVSSLPAFNGSLASRPFTC
ncbi:hypothetical protein L1887_11298 [Cichorium endivia]|nr:hypothetical protein L1887_11298 [Cichorium endivia]